ncbi:MAG: dual specificity protein phosphatase family protein [Chloroflexota bacterium]
MSNIPSSKNIKTINSSEFRDPAPLPPWALRRPLVALWFVVSRAGDNGRITPFRRLSHITEYIYLGGQVGRRGWHTLQKWGVQAMVNMRVEFDDRTLGIKIPYYLWLPTIDGTPPTVEQLAQGAKFIHEQTVAKRPVYIHCAAGVGRSPTQVIAYMMTRGSSIEESIERIELRRPIISLSPKQKVRLHQFEEYIQEMNIDYSEDRQHDPVKPAAEASVDVPAMNKDS